MNMLSDEEEDMHEIGLDWMNYLFMHFDLKFAEALSKSTESLRSIKFVDGIRD